MRLKKIFFFILPLVMVVTAFSQTLDEEIRATLRDYLASISGFQGAAVINTDTGEFLGYYIANPALESQKYKLAALVTNVVRQVENASEKARFHPVWLELNTDKGIILIALINKETFLGCRFAKGTPVGLIKYQVKKALANLRALLY